MIKKYEQFCEKCGILQLRDKNYGKVICFDCKLKRAKKYRDDNKGRLNKNRKLARKKLLK